MRLISAVMLTASARFVASSLDSDRDMSSIVGRRRARAIVGRFATHHVPPFSLHVARTPRVIAASAARVFANATSRTISRSAGGARTRWRNALVSALVRTGAAEALSVRRNWHGVMAFNYHRIGNGSGSLFDHGLWSASEEQFDCQVRFLKRNFDVIGTAELGTALSRPRGRHVLITFDDGYRDNYESAFKILRSHGATATFFISTGFIDHPRLSWWDEIAWMVRTSARNSINVAPYSSSPIPFESSDRSRAIRALLRVYKSLPSDATEEYLELVAQRTGSGRYPEKNVDGLWMTWDMVRQMHADGMSIGGHTVDHAVLAQMTQEAQHAQISGCAARLRAELEISMKSFSYPVGGRRSFNNITRRCLQECGVEYAFSYYGGIRSASDWDPYDIRRIPIESDTSFDQFRAIAWLPRIFGRAS